MKKEERENVNTKQMMAGCALLAGAACAYQPGDVLHGFKVTSVTPLPEVKGTMVRMTYMKNGAELAWLADTAERLEIKDSAPRPLLLGRDLIAMGMKPGVEFGKILKRVYEAQLDGKVTTKEEAQALATKK